MRETEAQIAQLYAALDKASAEIGRLEAQLDAERAARTRAEHLLTVIRTMLDKYDAPGTRTYGTRLAIEVRRLLADPDLRSTEEPKP